MSQPVGIRTNLSRVIDRSDAVLLDFDGPICSVFACLPAPAVASQLRSLLETEPLGLPVRLRTSDDPIQVLRLTSELGMPAARCVEAALRGAEIVASRSAVPTPYAREVLRACQDTGRAVAVVSNNARAAVSAYLRAHGLTGYVGVVIARETADPALLKPSPHLVLRAARELGVDARQCTLVGDSVTDIESARAAGSCSVGYANRQGKDELLAAAGADAVVSTMGDLAAALTGRAM